MCDWGPGWETRVGRETARTNYPRRAGLRDAWSQRLLARLTTRIHMSIYLMGDISKIWGCMKWCDAVVVLSSLSMAERMVSTLLLTLEMPFRKSVSIWE